LDDDQLLLWGGLGVGLAVLAWWKGPDVVEAVRDVVTRGDRLTYTDVGVDGQIADEPEQLRAQAAIALGRDAGDLLLDVYSAARMVRSEGAARANIRTHVLLNDAAEKGWSVHQTVTASNPSLASGRYGQQYTPVGPGGYKTVKRYSTARDPYRADVYAVEEAMVEHRNGLDPTGGAVKFLDISSMGGVQQGTGSYAAKVADWAKEGLRPFTLPGDSDLVVFRRVG